MCLNSCVISSLSFLIYYCLVAEENVGKWKELWIHLVFKISCKENVQLNILIFFKCVSSETEPSISFVLVCAAVLVLVWFTDLGQLYGFVIFEFCFSSFSFSFHCLLVLSGFVSVWVVVLSWLKLLYYLYVRHTPIKLTKCRNFFILKFFTWLLPTWNGPEDLGPCSWIFDPLRAIWCIVIPICVVD